MEEMINELNSFQIVNKINKKKLFENNNSLNNELLFSNNECNFLFDNII